jgi:hypothetical protein
MAMTDLEAFTPDVSGFGINVARTNRILARLLLDWTQHKEPGGKTRHGYLTAIYFDKLAEFFCRIWDQLKEARFVSFRSAYRSFRGIHGPGRAMPINRKKDDEESLGRDPHDYRRHRIAYTTEIVEKLGPPIGGCRSLFELGGAPAWSDGCRISPGLTPNQWQSWLEDEEPEHTPIFLTLRELDLVQKISRVISALPEKELRAIGTHASARQTIKAVEFNRGKWEDFLESALIGLDQEDWGSSLPGVCGRCLFAAEEIRRKSVTNRNDYEAALQKVRPALREIADDALLEALKAVQARTTAEIWDDVTVRRYGTHATDIVILSKYVRSYVHLGGLGQSADSQELPSIFESGAELVRLGLPQRLVFQDVSQITRELAKDVGKACMVVAKAIFDSLPVVSRARNTGTE